MLEHRIYLFGDHQKPTLQLLDLDAGVEDSIWHHEDDDGRRAGQPLGLQTRDVSGWWDGMGTMAPKNTRCSTVTTDDAQVLVDFGQGLSWRGAPNMCDGC